MSWLKKTSLDLLLTSCNIEAIGANFGSIHDATTWKKRVVWKVNFNSLPPPKAERQSPICGRLHSAWRPRGCWSVCPRPSGTSCAPSPGCQPSRQSQGWKNVPQNIETYVTIQLNSSNTFISGMGQEEPKKIIHTGSLVFPWIILDPVNFLVGRLNFDENIPDLT